MARTIGRGRRDRPQRPHDEHRAGPAADPEDNAPNDEELRKHRPSKDDIRRLRSKE